jgi:NADP-dependent 3-hydroxy acid dehydrogenase YdfG
MTHPNASNNYNGFFHKKIVIVTGAASGIGFEMARQMLEAGATVNICDWSEENLSSASEKLSTFGERAQFERINVADNAMVEGFVNAVAGKCGRIDLMINNAGIIQYDAIENISLERWHQIMNINFWGVIHGCYAVLPIMLKQGFGHIANTASLGGLLSGVLQGSYAASKFAIVGFTLTLRSEMQRKGIHVSAICPGNVRSGLVSNSAKSTEPESYNKNSELFEAIRKSSEEKPEEDGKEHCSPNFACREILEGFAVNEGVIIVPRKHVVKAYMLDELLPFYTKPELAAPLNSFVDERMRNWDDHGAVW